MERAAARAAHPAASEAAQQLRARDVEEDYAVEGESRAREQRVEGLRLGDRARKAVEDHARLGVGLGQTLAHEPNHHVVGDEGAGVHVTLGLEAEGCLGRHRLAQHVARGHVGHAPLLGKGLGLGALARARGAEKDDPEAHAWARAFLRRKPS